MIDIEKSKKVFQKYVEKYDLTNDKIKLKMIHTYCVMKTTEYICKHEGIDEEDYQLALLIALLHDIGRFEQLRRFNSFNDQFIDHANLGVELLFKQGMIRQFVEDNQYDETIKQAIAYHSLYQVPQIQDKRALMHVLLIRDSDKLDNFRVKNKESIETLFDIREIDFLNQRVTPCIIQDIKNHKLILKKDRKNEVDMWVSYLAFIFDLNFQSSFRYLYETDYVVKNIERFSYCEGLKQDMDIVKKECQQFILENIGI